MKTILTFLCCAIAAFGQAMLMPLPKQQFFDSNGNPLAGGKVYSYAAGTSTPLATYTDGTGSIANANPVILDAAGRANIWLGSASYKIELRDSSDVTIWTVDGINSTSNNGFIVSGKTAVHPPNTTTAGLQAYWDTDTAELIAMTPGGYLGTINIRAANIGFYTPTTLGGGIGPANIFLSAGGIGTHGSIVPLFDVSDTLGNSSGRFSHTYTQVLNLYGNIDATGAAGAINVLGSTTTNGNIILSPGAVALNASVVVNGARTDEPALYIVNKASATANAFQIRDSSGNVKFRVGGEAAAVPNSVVMASAFSLTADTYDLGATSNRWRKVWTNDIDASGTITLNNLTVSGTCTGCGGGGGGSSAFSSITSGTNTAATMTLGTGSTLTSSGTAIVNFGTAGATTPLRKDTAANISASTCGVGELAFATDGTAGRNLYFCTASNTWTQQVAGTGGAAFSALTGGTNSGGAAMLVGATSSLKPTSSGVIWATALVDSNQVSAVAIGTTASAVNQVTVTNAATAGKPSIAATGSDSNITLSLLAKGTGRIELGGTNAYVDGSGNLTVVSCTGCGGGGGSFLPLVGGTVSGSILASAGSIGSASNSFVDGIFSGTVYAATVKTILGSPSAPTDFFTWSLPGVHLYDLRNSSGALLMRIDNLNSPGALSFEGGVRPLTTAIYDVGSSSNYWRSIYFGTSLIQNGVTRIDSSGNAVIQNLTINGTCTGCGSGGGGGSFVPLAGGTMTGNLLANGSVDVGSTISPWTNGYFAAMVETQRVRMIRGATSAPSDYFDWFPDQSVSHVIRLLNASAQSLLTVDDTRAFSAPTLFQFAGQVYPSASNSYDLGASGGTWRNGYFGTAVVVNGTTMLNSSGQHVGAAVNVTGTVQSQASGSSIAFQNSNSNFSVDGNGNISSAAAVNVTGTNPYRVNGTAIVDASRNATFATLTTNTGGVVQSGATGATIAFQTVNTNFQVDGNGNISAAGQVNLTGGSSVYKMGGTTVIDASRNFSAATLNVGGTQVIDGSRNIVNAGSGTFASGVTFNGGFSTGVSTNSTLYIGTGSLYLRTFSGGDASCGAVTSGWIGYRTDTNELQACSGGVMRKVALF